jgi:hypothetical protein
VTIVEPRRGQFGKTRLGEFRAIELEKRRGDGMEAKGIAFLQHDTGKLAPDLDDEWFVHMLDHGLNLLVDVEMVTIRRLSNRWRC